MKSSLASELQFLTYSNLAKTLHGSFERHGGVSEGPFATLNFSTTPGDDPDCVKENRQRAQQALGIHTLCQVHQVHGDCIVKANPNVIEKADGLMTNQRGIGLMVMHADCQAALFYDPIKQVIAAVHCGWKGNVLNIYAKTVQKLHETYGTQAKDLRVALAPSLGPSAAEFINYKQEFPSSFWSYQVKPYYFDLWAIAKMQLTEAGIPAKQIEIAGICTYSNPSDYFSYRREKRSGRNASMIMLAP